MANHDHIPPSEVSLWHIAEELKRIGDLLERGTLVVHPKLPPGMIPDKSPKTPTRPAVPVAEKCPDCGGLGKHSPNCPRGGNRK